MKAIKFLIVVMFSVASTFSATSQETGETTDPPRDVFVDLSARLVDGNVYFNLYMLNESIPGVYSMVKIFEDGTFESIAIKEVGVNMINSPLVYSFVDRSVGQEPVTYKLMRIGQEVDLVGSWQYCQGDQSMCLEETLVAVNE